MSVPGAGGCDSISAKPQRDLYFCVGHQGCPGPGLPLGVPDDPPGPGPPGARGQDVPPQHHLRLPQAKHSECHMGVRWGLFHDIYVHVLSSLNKSFLVKKLVRQKN